MPQVNLEISDHRAKGKVVKFSKYIEANEFNVLIQNKFQEWEEQASECFGGLIGEDILKPTGAYHKNGKRSFLFERNNNETNETPFYMKEMNKQTSNSLSTIVLPLEAQASEEGIYMRLEGYQLTLVNSVNGQNLITTFFNLDDENEQLTELLANKVDLNYVFSLELKVFYNTAQDYWRIMVSLEDIMNKYHRKKHPWHVENLQKKMIPIHID